MRGISRCWYANVWHGTDIKKGTAKFSEERAGDRVPDPDGMDGQHRCQRGLETRGTTRFTPSSSMSQRCSLGVE